jgi:hypothetical protein
VRLDFKMQRYRKLIVVFLCMLAFLFSSTREKTIWRHKVMLTLKLFSQNIYFERESKSITVGSDSKEFLAALKSKRTVIKGVKIKSLLLSPNNSQEDLDVAFINNIELAEKIAGNAILVFSSNEKCTTAAFIITVSRSNRLKITYNKRNIKNQGAAFPAEVFKTIDKYQRKK